MFFSPLSVSMHDSNKIKQRKTYKNAHGEHFSEVSRGIVTIVLLARALIKNKMLVTTCTGG